MLAESNPKCLEKNSEWKRLAQWEGAKITMALDLVLQIPVLFSQIYMLHMHIMEAHYNGWSARDYCLVHKSGLSDLFFMKDR